MCDHSESMYGRCVACGMTWEGQARAAAERERKWEACRRHPIGSRVSTVVATLGGRTETVSGEVIEYKYGELRVKTEFHGVLCVHPDRVVTP